jgi:hypothetical protein
VVERKLVYSTCWVSSIKLFLVHLIFAGWVEVRNPTLQFGLNMHDALCAIPIFSLKRSAPQVKRSSSAALLLSLLTFFFSPFRIPTSHFSSYLRNFPPCHPNTMRYALCSISVLSLKRSALQVKRSSSPALILSQISRHLFEDIRVLGLKAGQEMFGAHNRTPERKILAVKIHSHGQHVAERLD